MEWKDPPGRPEMIECGRDLAPLLPTPHLKLDPWGKLHQWFEAQSVSGDTTYKIGKWREVI